MSDKQKIKMALDRIFQIDQVLRILTGCKPVKMTAKDVNGKKYTYEELCESKEYKEWVARYEKEDEDGGWEWDVGIPP